MQQARTELETTITAGNKAREKLEEQFANLVQANEDMRGRFDDARRQLEDLKFLLSDK